MRDETTAQIKVWDPFVRVFHWTLAGAFVVAYASAEEWEWLHVNAGYLIAALLVLRLLWGFVGTRHARFTDFVRSPRTVWAYLRDALRLRAPRYLGHNPAGGAMVLALMIALAATVGSGLVLYAAEDFAGPLAGWIRGAWAADLAEGLHEVAANLTVLLVVLHVAGVLFASLEHGENLVRSMIDGRKRGMPG